MSTLYSLQFSNQTLPFDEKVKIYQSKINKKALPQYYLLLDGKLYTYTYNNFNWDKNLILNSSVNNEVIYFPNTLKNKESLLLLKTNKGIDFYQYVDSKFNLVLGSNEYRPFDTFKAWSNRENIIKSGHFYSDKNFIGILSKNRTEELQFHAVIDSKLKAHENPLYSLDDSKLNILRNTNTSKAHFFLADLKRKGQENLIIHNRQGLNVYEFDEENVLHHFLQVPESSKTNGFEENIFFPDLTGQPLKDIVLFNASGLFVYQYKAEQNNYQIIDYNPLFDEQRGWNDKYMKTIRFKDINFDGNQEMLFTGPQGIDILTFDNSTLQWKSVLDISDIAVPERHGNIVEIVSTSSVNTEYPIIFTQHQNEMHWAKIVEKKLDDFEIELPEEDSTDVVTSLSVIPEVIKLEIADGDKPTILLRDQLDCSSIINGVNKITGKAKFKLPLIELPNFSKNEKLNLYFDGSSKDATILGVGWSFPVNAILMDHQGSIFSENERFILLLDDFPHFLTLDPDNSTDNVHHFKLSDQESEIQIRYFKDEERWEIDFKGLKQIYGRRKDSQEESISYDITWENWRGAGSSLSGQVQLATAWFLIEERKEQSSAIYYNYHFDNLMVPGSTKIFTREVYLKTIKDNEGNEIIFHHSLKDPGEYHLPSLTDKNGNYNTKKEHILFLEGYSVTTYNYRQDIFFIYKIENGNRLLTQIVQANDPTNRPILDFSYKTILNTYMLEQIILPTGTSVEFSYETITCTSDVIQKVDLTTDVKASYNIDYGQDFVLISYLNNYNHVVLKMFNRELTNEMYSSLSELESRRFPFLGRSSVNYYEVKILEESVAIILVYDNNKDVCLIHKEQDKWSLNPKYYNYSKDAIIRVGNDFIAVLDARELILEIVVWDKKSKEWIKEKIDTQLIENSKDSLLIVFGKVFFIYDDNVVTVSYRNKKNEWQSKAIVTLPGIISNIKKNLDNFDLDTDLYNELMHYFKYYAFQISNNLVLFNWLNVEYTKIYSEIKLLSLNSKYEVAHQEHYRVTQDDLLEISKDYEQQLNDKIKIKYTLAYKKDGNQFKVFFKKIQEDSQESLNEFCKDNEDKNCVSEVKEYIEQLVAHSQKKYFILNLQKYLAYLRSSVVTCGREKFTFIGDKWLEDTITDQKLSSEEWSFSIDNKFILEKGNSESSIKLYKKEENESRKSIQIDLEVKNITQIFNKYPKYLVYGTEREDLKVIFYELLDNAFIKKFTLPQGETLSIKSDYNTIVTHAQSASDNDYLTLHLRQLFNVQSILPNPVINKLTVNFDNDYKRITGYDYDPSSVKVTGDILYYEKTYIIPGNNKSSYGFIEESRNTTGNVNKIYDAQGKLVKIEREEQSNNVKERVSEETESINTVLFDMTGNLEVAQFYPYKMQDDEVSYYGFEDYEVNKINAINSTNQNRWLFNESDIVKEKFSLTGKNYLNLSNSRLLGTFQPLNQNQHYVASCWVRSPGTVLQIGTIAPYLKAALYTDDNRPINGHFSEVKFKYDDWAYLEVVIDLFYSKEVYKNIALHTNSVSNENPLKIEISVSPNLNSTIDVDHIRFSPLDSDFQAMTYNFNTKEIKEVINSNGLITRYLYNDYQDQIASINENGDIKKLNIFTKASSIGRIVNLKSKIQIQPNGGFYEDFNPYSFIRRWKVENDLSWKIAPSEILHRSNQFDRLKLRNMHDTFDSYGIRLYYSLQSESSTIIFNDVLKLQREGNHAIFLLPKLLVRAAPTHGEILLITEHNRLMIWIDGGLYFDNCGLDKLLFDIEIYGMVKIRDLLLFLEPSVHVTYFNALDEKIQEIDLESANSAIVTEFLYDELGRQCITTKSTRLQRSDNEPVIAYYSDYVTNKNPHSTDSVWRRGQIQGAFEILKPHNYYQTTYNHNPLNENSAIGLPGKEFSISGKFAKRFSSSTENLFIKKNYPDQNYRYQVEYKLGGIEDIKVFDKRNNLVAKLLKTPGEVDLLATYEYNDDGKLVQILSPLYHNLAGTSHNIDSQLHCFSNENALRVANNYDNMGNIINTMNPDSGKVEYIYSDSGQLKFNIFYSNFNSTVIENIVYFDYDNLARLTNTGKLISPPAKEELGKLELTKNNTEKYQVFYHSNFEREPTLRGKLRRMITYNDGIPFIEEYVLNEDKSFLSKRIFVMNKNSNEDLIITTNKRYRAGKLIEIEYPVDVQGQPFKVSYSYNKLGKIDGIGIPSKNNGFIKYIYNSDGLIDMEHHLPDQTNFNFTRKYSYNSASYLTQLQDKYLTENIYYTEGSYGGYGFGDGVITRTEFEATWHQYADISKISLNEQSFSSKHIKPEVSKLCFDKLKGAGYINQYNRQAKIYYPSLEMDFPRVCSEGIKGRQIQNILGRQGFPSKYGHLYDYGTYQELIKAKYFVGEEIPAPLQPDTFAKIIPKIDGTTSRDIWKILGNAKYITLDKSSSNDTYFKPHGKKGDSFIRSKLSEDLEAISSNHCSYKYYDLLLQKALAFYFSKKQDLSSFKLNLKKTILDWSRNAMDEKNQDRQKEADKILKMLENKGYLQNPLDENFNDLLEKYHSVIPEIVTVLSEHFSKELGEAEFDVEAFEIDENGNHKKFYRGFERYELQYHGNSNQIHTINLKSFRLPNEKTDFSVKHDSRGNIIQALHKGIKNITYHPVANCVTSIELEDGTKVIFHYNAKGERILKRVFDKSGELKKEIHYVRDELGRSLVEREMIWNCPTLPPSVLVTVFIYGPKGLVGFIRRDQYYSVITDHEGSIRLIVKDGEVVTAYDYLPYGNLMRQFGTNSEAHISYRYTGQEWDEETDLYNYHARFYDPSIGRFYQHDPKMQYFSPYKYAGDSPVSMVDPNGEFAFLLVFAIIALAALGGYLAGAAASGSWNPAKWNFKDPMLYTAIIFGIIGGALLPIFLPESIVALTSLGLSTSLSYGITFGLGAVGTYLGMANSANEWSPTKWDYTKPELWNGAFTGFATFAEAPGVLHSNINFYKSLSSGYRKLFIAGSFGSGAGLIELKRIIRGSEYDFSKPNVYYDFVESLIFAADLPTASIGGYRFFRKNGGNVINGLQRLAFRRMGYSFLGEVNRMDSVPASLTKMTFGIGIPILSGTILAYTEGKFDFSQPITYKAFIDGVMMGSSLGRHAYKSYTNRVIIEPMKAVVEEAVTYGKKSMVVYTAAIKEIPSEDHKLYTSINIKDLIKDGKIPNSVLSVIKMKNNKILVAYSGLDQPGFISLYVHETGAHYNLKNNKMIDNREVSLNDDQVINALIRKAIDDKVADTKESNFQAYLREKVNLDKDFTDILLSLDNQLFSYFNNNDFRPYFNGEIEKNMQDSGYVDRQKFTNIISHPIKNRLDQSNEKIIKRITQDIEKQSKFVSKNPNYQIRDGDQFYEINRKIVEVERAVGIPEEGINLQDETSTILEKFDVRVQNIRTTKNQLTFDLKKLIEMKREITEPGELQSKKSVNVWTELYEKHFKEYPSKFVPWKETNCAEPHAVSAVMRLHNIFPFERENRYNIYDIKYISAFGIDHTTGELIPKERCFYCKETTSRITNVVTDPEWKAMIDNEREELLSMPRNSFYPYYNITYIRLHNITKTGKNSSSRKKRSTVDNYINNQDLLINITEYSDNTSENYNSDYLKNDMPINNTEEKAKKLSNNLFSWIKTTWNQLFNSKAILYEKASMPHMLKGITDSNNSFTHATALVDVNSTILLVDTVMRKITGQKYISSEADNNTSLLETRGYSLDVGLAFEKTMKYAASKSGISMHRFNIHYMDIQEKIIDKIISGRLDEIAEILISHVEKSCPLQEKGYPGKLSPKKFKKFINEFSKRIDIELNEIMQSNKRIKGM